MEKPSTSSLEALIDFVEKLQIREEIKVHNHRNARRIFSVRNFWNPRRKRSKWSPIRKCGEKCHRQRLHPATAIRPKVWRAPLRAQNPSSHGHGIYLFLHLHIGYLFPCLILFNFIMACLIFGALHIYILKFCINKLHKNFAPRASTVFSKFCKLLWTTTLSPSSQFSLKKIADFFVY